MAFITVDSVSKEFKVEVKQRGVIGKLRSLVRPHIVTRQAVRHISFSVEEGEIIGYLGPNGAGKSTMIKMLCGIMHPSSGHIQVNGCIPYKERRKFSMTIGVVFGQRSQLWWDLPAIDSLELYKDIYKVSSTSYKRSLNEFNELLDLHEFAHTPVRQLSLGQRMRMELAAAMLHHPQILFLDEPTIGLDIMVKEKIRDFILQWNKQRKTTVILTTHDVIDIERLCNRILIINSGEMAFDGSAKELEQLYTKEKQIIVTFKEAIDWLPPLLHATVQWREGNQICFAVERSEDVQEVIKRIVNSYEVTDIQIRGADLESIIKQVYQTGKRDDVHEVVYSHFS
ncbi:ABC transporter ATP-binding protein [Paenibacillus agilis]|uniref:ATP-binding cassette domain-containing protein n=1 Tax=Paenibacillus agilis TaxID=3020863 RepID=A0A559IX12_9BACL|nr:ATP-binding cassette domain-containing protein [Paenibacillus agilis]TVX92153.1 ATP-binding cassette domain-containing protein [Paenibacillus agilis]